jgi:hypothetical protein
LNITGPSLRLSRVASIVLGDQRAFAATVLGAFAIKLVLSAFTPASSDFWFMLLQGNTVGGLWISLLDAIASSCKLVTGLTANTWVQSPPSLSTDFALFGLLIRLPTLVFDLSVASALYYLALQVGTSLQNARLACLAWLINPYNTFTVEMIGAPDIAASLATVIMILFLLRKKLVFAGVALTAGTALKLYPIFLLPPVLAYVERNRAALRIRVLFVVLSLLGLAAYLDWIFQGDLAKLQLLFVYTPVTQPITDLLTLGTEIGASVLAIVLVVTYYLSWVLAKEHNVPVMESVLVVLLVYYTFSSLYPEYLLWALPFITLDVVVRRRHIGLLVATLVLMFSWGFFYFGGYVTTSGYSLLFFPLQGNQLPWYSQTVSSFLANAATPVLIPPFLKAGLSVATLVYALTFLRNWFRSPPRK